MRKAIGSILLVSVLAGLIYVAFTKSPTPKPVTPVCSIQRDFCYIDWPNGQETLFDVEGGKLYVIIQWASAPGIH